MEDNKAKQNKTKPQQKKTTKQNKNKNKNNKENYEIQRKVHKITFKQIEETARTPCIQSTICDDFFNLNLGLSSW